MTAGRGCVGLLLLLTVGVGCDPLYLEAQLPQRAGFRVGMEDVLLWGSGVYQTLGYVQSGNAANSLSLQFQTGSVPRQTDVTLSFDVFAVDQIPAAVGIFPIVDASLPDHSRSYATGWKRTDWPLVGAGVAADAGTVTLTYSSKSSVSGALNAHFVELDGGTVDVVGTFRELPVLCHAEGC